MPERANVTSVEAIQAFRTAMLVFLSKARPTLEEAGGEVLRVRLWLQNDRRNFWEGQLRRRARQLEDAEAALFSSKISKYQEVSAVQQMAVQKARRAVAEAEERLKTIKRWDRDYENRTEPLLKQQEKLNNILAVDVPNAVAHLGAVIDSLQKYADVIAPATDVAPSAGPADPPANEKAGP